MRLGYACVNLTLNRKLRSLRLATLQAQGMPYLQELVNENLHLLADILCWNREHQIMMFRISSDLIPLGSHKAVNYTGVAFPLASEIASLAKDMRLSLHPGQYTLPSATGRVWENSYRDLLYHSFLLDALGLDGDIVLHGGGVYGDRPTTATRIINNIASLPPEIRRRLRLENDEHAWSIEELLPICEEATIPLIVDNLHHQLNGNVPLKDLAWDRIQATWHGLVPKLHYSEQDPEKRPGAHSEYVDEEAFVAFLRDVHMDDFDVMLECKAKELALLELRMALSFMLCIL